MIISPYLLSTTTTSLILDKIVKLTPPLDIIMQTGVLGVTMVLIVSITMGSLALLSLIIEGTARVILRVVLSISKLKARWNSGDNDE